MIKQMTMLIPLESFSETYNYIARRNSGYNINTSISSNNKCSSGRIFRVL